MKVEMKLITPVIAQEWLNKYNTENRPLKEWKVKQYARDMSTGNWTNSNDAICLRGDNVLANGQHRLWAIVESGVSLTLPVMRGFAKEDMLNMDRGVPRSFLDNARLAGLGVEHMHLGVIACARAFIEGEPPNVRKALSDQQKLEILTATEQPVAWAMQHVHKIKFLSGSNVTAAVARAFAAGVDIERLERFCIVLGEGYMADASERAAVTLRNYLIKKGSDASSRPHWRDTFLKVQNAISYFIRGEDLRIIKTLDEEPYPIKGRKEGSTTPIKRRRVKVVDANANQGSLQL